MNREEHKTAKRYDLVLKGGRVVDPAFDRDAVMDVAVTSGRILAVAPSLPAESARRVIDVSGKLVLPGLIDTHAHIYQHVTGKFGLAADLVGVQSGVTTLVDQGGPSCMTLGGFRKFIAEPARSRVLCFISCYLVGGLEGHLYPDLYGPHGVNVDHTVRTAMENRDLVRGIKAHAEIGGASRWGLEVIKLGKEIARQTRLPLYIHLGQLWPTREGSTIDADEVVRELVPLMEEGDVLAHPFTRHPGGFVSQETGDVHPVVWEALERGVVVDVGHGSHFSFEMAKRVLDAGIRPFTLGADLHGYNVRMPQPGLSASDQAANPFAGKAPFNLTVAMTELLALGMELPEVVATVTANPAKMLGLHRETGALIPGSLADVTVLDLLNGRFELADNSGTRITTDRFLQPCFCLRAGEVVQADSPLVCEPILSAA